MVSLSKIVIGPNQTISKMIADVVVKVAGLAKAALNPAKISGGPQNHCTLGGIG